MNNRSSGILAHISSLPSPYGIGDIGPASHAFIDFLVRCEQSYWQFLPTGPTNALFDDSPYMGTSAFAGSLLLISPDLLFQEDLISRELLESHPDFSPYSADIDEVRKYKSRLLNEAYLRFRQDRYPDYSLFLQDNPWIDDFAMFMTCKEIYYNIGWFDWPQELATRDPEALSQLKSRHSDRMNYYRFEQFEFFRQWQLLRKHAGAHAIHLFGDLPIYVSYDSVDVWAHQEIFELDRKTFRPTHVAGVPPDYFSKTGQRWGNPLYDWQNKDSKIQQKLLNWWADRLSHLFHMVDMVRIDHFRGFESYWSIPEENETAVDGVWLKGPGRNFFQQIFARLGLLNIVAEDLGIITQEVVSLRDELGFPGMRVLQFAFDGTPDNTFLPYNFTTPNCIVYTGTHDNDTTVGWFFSDRLDDAQRAKIKMFCNRGSDDRNGIHRDMIYLAQSSIANLCIFPLQDILGFGNDCKMNSPGVSTGNWRWRCASWFLTDEIAEWLRTTTRLFGRTRPADQETPKEQPPDRQ